LLEKERKQREMKRLKFALNALILVITISACQPGGEIEVHDYWLRSAAQGKNSAMYMMIQNRSRESDELVGASSDIAKAVELHETMINSNGTMQMSPVSSVPLEPDSEAVFEPGGLHIMFIGLKQELKVGDKVEVTLQFKNHENIVLSVPVQEGGGGMDH
jgi:copper(I)-binding protein